MKEKISLALKLKERILIKNFSLNSLKRLPPEIYKRLPQLLNNFLLLYKAQTYKPELQILSDSKFQVKKTGNLPSFRAGEILILILPFPDKRFIFQTQIVEENESGYILEILDPRAEERVPIKENMPVFFYLFSNQYIQELIQKPEYQLFRESNFSEENFDTLEELHLHDLILNENHNIDENFKKLIRRPLFVGNVVDISRAGICASTSGHIKFDDPFNLFYLNFNLPLQNKIIKFGLFCHLRDTSYASEKTFFHFSFLVSMREDFWKIIKEHLKS